MNPNTENNFKIMQIKTVYEKKNNLDHSYIYIVYKISNSNQLHYSVL